MFYSRRSQPRNTLLDMYASTRHNSSKDTPKEKQFFLVINEDDDDAQDDNDGRDAPPGTRRRGERWVLEEEANSFGGGRVRAGDRRGRRRW